MKKVKKNAVDPFQDLYRQSACQANQLAEGIFISADTQVSRELHRQLKAGDYSRIVSASVDPMDYTNADIFSRDYLCVELMSKFPHWDIGVNRSAVALQKFLEVEDRLSRLRFDENPIVSSTSKKARMRAIEMTARLKIEKILGQFSLDEASSSFAFGPGASTSLSRRRSDASFKFGAERPHMSYNAEILASALSKAHPTWRFSASVVAGSKLVTVPKNAKTDRTICIEPDLNMYFQKGIGACIRRRLNRWGLLLPNAQQTNAEYARIGSANGRLATVDLSSASDSIHMELVRLLLPSDWVDVIEQTRSPFTVLPNEAIHTLRKVSSMGNGYTFELETLMFYGICSAVIDLLAGRETDRQCTVFGDDIIIASELVEPLREVLLYFGFEMNSKKTFSVGPFRESCGKHYFLGTDVTPFYVRDRIDSVHRKYWAANTVRRYSRLHWGLDSRYQPVYNQLVASIPRFFRDFKIPEGYGDGGLVVDWDEARPSRAIDGHDAWLYEDLIPKFGKKKIGGQGVLLKELHLLDYPERPSDALSPAEKHDILLNGVRSEIIRTFLKVDAIGTDDFVSGRFEVSPSVLPKPQGYKRHTGTAQQWPSYGPWIQGRYDSPVSHRSDEVAKETTVVFPDGETIVISWDNYESFDGT